MEIIMRSEYNKEKWGTPTGEVRILTDWDDIRTYRSDLANAFKLLRKQGYVARMAEMCCGSCASAKIDSDIKKMNKKAGKKKWDADKVVFFHQQADRQLRENGLVWLNWDGDAKVIYKALHDSGLQCWHSGSHDNSILVRVDDCTNFRYTHESLMRSLSDMVNKNGEWHWRK